MEFCGGGTILSTPTGSFNDGSGGSNYGNNQQCYWFISPPCASSVTLSFSAFNTEEEVAVTVEKLKSMTKYH